MVKKEKGNEREVVEAMLRCMLHEPFYTRGIYHGPDNLLHVGFCSLPGAFSDCMPIMNETKEITLFMTGECYFDREAIDDLASRGHQFEQDNGSCLVHFYEEEGARFFKTLNGWFNGLIIDRRSSRATLFNDRFGIRRIYFYETPDFFAFASEAKSLLKVFPELREISLKSVGEFLNYDCVLENRTYFPMINLLPPCSAWVFENGKTVKATYLDMVELESQPVMGHVEFIRQLETTFVRILPRYFRGGPVGIGLTGGLDTRLIMACADAAPGQLPCYTFGGTYRDIFDVRIAPKVAEACGQPHTALRLHDEELLRNYAAQVEKATYISDGLEGTDKVDVIPFNRMAREIAPVRMTGKYGSQVLKGIFGFDARPPYMHLINEDFKAYMEEALRTASDQQQGNKLTFLLQNAIPWWWNAFVTLESSQVEVRSPFLDNDLIKVLYQAPPLGPGFGTRFELDLIAKTKPALMAFPTTGTYGGNRPWAISKAMKSFIKAMLILDKIYIRERLPLNMTHIIAKLDYWLISPLHLDCLVMGFADFRRYRRWFRDELSVYLQDVLLDAKTLSRPYWNRKNLEKIVMDHNKGKGTYLREIRKVLQVELTHRVLLERL